MKNKVLALVLILLWIAGAKADTIPSPFSKPMTWRIGMEAAPSWAIPSNDFMRGNNPEGRRVDAAISGDLRADFSFNPNSRPALIYPGLYQGIGIGATTFFCNSLLGAPFSTYAYQGAPIRRFSDRLWLGYEWQFGAAFGWKAYLLQDRTNNAPEGSAVTAHMGLGVKLHYALNESWELTGGLMIRHYSNGNTSWPNRGINTMGATVGISYMLTRPEIRVNPNLASALAEEADRQRWTTDITVYGAWRKRVVRRPEFIDGQQLAPGKFGILGLQVSPLRKLDRYVAVGPQFDFQYDESAGLAPYWVEGTFDSGIKFFRPPFRKQISAGISAHAELTMPIFSLNVGLGYDFLNPEGNKAFYQMITLKTFLTKHLYINTGYRLGNFSTQQNLLLGVGVRL